MGRFRLIAKVPCLKTTVHVLATTFIGLCSVMYSCHCNVLDTCAPFHKRCVVCFTFSLESSLLEIFLSELLHFNLRFKETLQTWLSSRLHGEILSNLSAIDSGPISTATKVYDSNLAPFICFSRTGSDRFRFHRTTWLITSPVYRYDLRCKYCSSDGSHVVY